MARDELIALHIERDHIGDKSSVEPSCDARSELATVHRCSEDDRAISAGADTIHDQRHQGLAIVLGKACMLGDNDDIRAVRCELFGTRADAGRAGKQRVHFPASGIGKPSRRTRCLERNLPQFGAS
jgi:hypothetical protein